MPVSPSTRRTEPRPTVAIGTRASRPVEENARVPGPANRSEYGARTVRGAGTLTNTGCFSRFLATGECGDARRTLGWRPEPSSRLASGHVDDGPRGCSVL